MNAKSPEQAPLLLVADDHRLNRVLMERILESLGYRSVIVQNGQEALDAVRAGQFDGVLLDLEMPVMGGLQAARAIRALGGAAEKLPLLALTAHSEPEFERDARAHGFDGFVTKPILPADLAEALNRLLSKN